MFNFPKGLYCDIRIEHTDSASYYVQNSEVMQNSETSVAGAMIRVYDGRLWYTSVTNDLQAVQDELDNLASVAQPDDNIENNPVVKMFEVHKDTVLKFEGDNDLRKTTREMREDLVKRCIDACDCDSFDEIKQWGASCSYEHKIKEFYSSKGAEIKQDMQQCFVHMFFDIVIDGITTTGSHAITGFDFDSVKGREDEIVKKRDRFLDYAKNALDVTPGEYVCVLAPEVTGMFTHESFGHKSEADFMLNDRTLRDEWEMGKKVGSELVSICDSASAYGVTHRGDIAYDDEGTKPKETWLIKNGVLTGRLHDANSAAALGEELTGNARAQDFGFAPMVRMTNTYMLPGDRTPEEIISEVKDGIYIFGVIYGTGQSTFTLKPSCCYRITDGKLDTPVRVNVVNGSVFQTLFDIDAIGNDITFCDTGTCGKNGQAMPVSDAGPTIRVRKLTAN